MSESDQVVFVAASGNVTKGNITIPDYFEAETGCQNTKNAKYFNIEDKTRGFLSLGPTKFKFVGPDRDLCSFSNIEEVLHVANIIQATGLPNYKLARFTIKSGLNLPAWEKYLHDYPDESILQYLKFGFPLSLTDLDRIHNVNVTNHFTALAYPTAIQQYLDKEKLFGAILGPSAEVNSQQFHCSPLLTRPKDLDKRRVILN